MSESPNKLAQFWQELRRRKVIKAIAMYAGAAFIILELLEKSWELRSGYDHDHYLLLLQVKQVLASQNN